MLIRLTDLHLAGAWRNLGLTHPGCMMPPLCGWSSGGVVGGNLGLTHPGCMIPPLRGWGLEELLVGT